MLFRSGIALWLAYGWALGAWPIIVANTLTLILASIILATKVRVEQRSTAQQKDPQG